MHPFVIVGIYCVGTLPGKGGFEPKNTVILAFELPEVEPLEFREDDGTITRKPRMISKRYNLSFNEKAKLRIDLESLRGRPFTKEEADSFQLEKLLGVTGNLNVMHKPGQDKVFADVTGLFGKHKGQVITGTMPKEVFSVFSLENAAELAGCLLPEWIQKLVQTSEEYINLVSNPQPQQQPQQVSDNDGGPLDDVAF
jgi:hypothetical protein